MTSLCRSSAGASVALVVVTAFTAACDGTSTMTALGTAPDKCTVGATASATSLQAAGGAGVLTITTQPECTWTASSESSWISGLTPSSGQGSAQVAFVVAANPDPVARQGGVMVSDQRVMISQSAATVPCHVELASPSGQATAAGGTLSVPVSAPTGCAWVVSSGAAWIRIASEVTGTGTGTVTLAVGPNSGAPRAGIVGIGGQTFSVSQAGAAACEVAVRSSSVPVPATGGTASFEVITRAGCTWTTTSQAPWITVTAGSSGEGSGTVALAVLPNSGPSRTAQFSVGSQVVPIVQEGTCAVSISPTAQAVDATGAASLPLAVAAPPGCPWTIGSTVAWLSVVAVQVARGTGPPPLRWR